MRALIRKRTAWLRKAGIFAALLAPITCAPIVGLDEDYYLQLEPEPERVCGGRAGPPMVRIADQYCIDSTEVTNTQYAAFRSSTEMNPAAHTVAGCPVPSSHKLRYVVEDYPPDQPVTQVPWCFAASYCEWAHKRLCGRIGGGPSGFDDTEQAWNRSEWVSICRNGDAGLPYPYGDEFDAGACTGAGKLTDVGSAENCRGALPPYDSTFDMSGNVAEWEDACEPPTADGGIRCRVRGGSTNANNVADELTCTGDPGQNQPPRDLDSGQIGFRCCADLVVPE